MSRSPLARSVSTLAAALAALLLMSSVAPAQESGITVTGGGEVKGRPTSIELRGSLGGDSEMAADALVKYKDAKRRAVDAINNLKIANLAITGEGPSIVNATGGNDQQAMQMAMMRGGQAATIKPRVAFNEQMRISMTGVDKLSDDQLAETLVRLLDACKDVGLRIGPPAPTNYYQMQMMGMNQQNNVVTFKLADPAALREEAYKLAVEDCRKRAERLAKLSGVKLGGVRSVQEVAVAAPASNNTSSVPYQLRMMMGDDDAPDGEAPLASKSMSEIPVRVRLTIVFEIIK